MATQRPDGNGLFTINTVMTPAYDGQWVVLRDIGIRDDLSLQAIWSYNTKDGTFRKLVDLHTVQPGGTATFSELHLQDTAPAVRNGTVVFQGRGSSVTGLLYGIYSVPVAGGTVSKIADYATADPSGGTFSRFDTSGTQIGGFSFDGTTAAFRGQSTTLATGIYAASANGSGLSLIADSAHSYAATGASVSAFSGPAVSGGNVVLVGTAGADPSTAYNGLYLGKAGASGALTELVNSNQQLPGGSNNSFHTRFDSPYLAMDGTLVAFHATDSGAPVATQLSGLYWTDLTSHTINKIADTGSGLTGLGKLKSIGEQGVAVSQGNVLFRAADVTAGYPGNNALYIWNNGTAKRVIGTGDVLDGKTVQVVHHPGPSALSSAGFVFVVEFAASSNFAVYYATPGASAGTAASFNAASYAANGTLAAGTIASAFGQGLADAATAAGPPPLLTTLGNVSLSVRDSAGTSRLAPLYFAGPTQINYVVPDGTAAGAATVTVTRGGQTVATGTLQVATVAPGLFTANGDGKGVAAAIALKATASGAQTWQYTADCPGAAGSCVTLPIDLGAATDQVFLELFGTGIRGYKTSITATIGGTSVTPAFFVQPEYPGMDQVNIPIDRSLAGRGDVDVILTVDGVPANTVKINVK